jgi:hypothetical protein
MTTNRLNHYSYNHPIVIVYHATAEIPSEIKQYKANLQTVTSNRDILIDFFKQGIKVIDEARAKIRKENPNLFS